MESKTLYKTVVSTITYPDGSLNVSRPCSYVTFSVSPGPMIKGDRHRPNPWNYTILDEQSGWYRLSQVVYGTDRYESLGHSAGAYPMPEVDPSFRNTHQEAVSGVLGKLRSGTGANIGVDVAQAHQTVDFFNANKRLKSGAKTLSRGLKSLSSAATEGSSALANAWLEFQYGFKPLAGTIYAGLTEMQNQVVGPTLKRFRHRATSRVNEHVRLDDMGCPGKRNAWDIDVTAKESTTITIEMTGLDSLAQRAARWTTLNPVSLGWELVPYSFVVDWFFNVGQYLEDLETAILYNNRPAQIVTSTLRTVTLSGTRPTMSWFSDPAQYTYVHVTPDTRTRTTFNRTVSSSIPFPDRPQLKFKLGSSQLLSAAALLRQFL